MQINFLNLDRSKDRLNYFMETNKHMTDLRRVCAIDGSAIDRNLLEKNGLISGNPNYTSGAIGCALSHRELWRRCISENSSMTIAEDDAMFSYRFEERSRELLKKIGQDWDFIMWGYSFLSFIWVDLIPGIHTSEIRLHHDKLLAGIDRFQSTDSPATLMKLKHAFNFLCYSVSPRGAQTLLDRCFPLRHEFIPFRDYGIVVENTDIDCVANAVFPDMNSFICVAPLVTTENRMKSTIR